MKEELSEKQIKTKAKKAKTYHDYRHLAEAVCANETLKTEYAHSFYEKAINLAAKERNGRNTIALCGLAESALSKSFLNDKVIAKKILDEALILTNNMSYMSYVLEQAIKLEDEEFMNKIFHSSMEIEEYTIDDILGIIIYMKEPEQIQNLIDKAANTESSYMEFQRLSDHFYKKGEIEATLNCLKTGIQKIHKQFEEENLFLKLTEIDAEGTKDVLQLLLENIDAHTPKIDFSENMFIDYNPDWGRYLSIYLDFKDMAKQGNFSIYLDMEQRTILGRRYHQGNYNLKWHGVSDTPNRVSKAFDRNLTSYTGFISIKSADTLESFLKNEFDHQWVQDQKLRNVKNPKLRFEKVEWLWELSCKNGELLDATKSISEFCRVDDILNTVGDGSQIFPLRDYIFQNK